jgi:hypothetical protein
MNYYKIIKTEYIEAEIKLSFPVINSTEPAENYMITNVQYGLTHHKNELQYSRFLYRSLASIVDLTLKPNVKLDVVILVSNGNEWATIFDAILDLFKEVYEHEKIELCKNYDVKLKKLEIPKVPTARLYVVYTPKKIYAVSKMCNNLIESKDLIDNLEKLKHEKIDKQ